MIRVKSFEKNKDGKIELTEEQLQALVSEAYENGREDERTSHVLITYGRNDFPSWWNTQTTPYYTTTGATGTPYETLNTVGTRVVGETCATEGDTECCAEIKYGTQTQADD